MRPPRLAGAGGGVYIGVMMKRIAYAAAAAAFAVGGAMAADGAAPVISLDDYRWIKRPVIVFADSPRDPRYAEQVAGFAEPDAAAGLEERDVVLIPIGGARRIFGFNGQVMGDL